MNKRKLSQQARFCKNKKLRLKQQNNDYVYNPIQHQEVNVTPIIIDDFVFNPLKHRTQGATRGLCTEDIINYIENEWKSIQLLPSDRKCSKIIKVTKEISTAELLIQRLIHIHELKKSSPNESSKPNNNNTFNKCEEDFMELLYNDIIEKKPNYKEKNAELWIAFGKWLGFEEPIKKRQVRRHIKKLWKKTKSASEHQKDKDKRKLSTIAIANKTRKEKIGLITSARNNFKSLQDLVQFYYITEPECITDSSGQTLIHLEQLDNHNAVLQATNAVNEYYYHTLNHPSHRSNNFWKDFIEHFGVYTRNNLLPYTSSNTASTHNIDHQKCVNDLISNLKPLSDSVNRFLQNNYSEYYAKLSELNWGPFGPRSFGVFPMIAVNFNTISDFHWDEHDDPNSLCCLVALGDYEGGELCFPQLEIVIPLKPGQVVAFSSRLLLHGNFYVTKGLRHSIVYFIHDTFFHHLRKQNFAKVYDDYKAGINRDAAGKIIKDKIKQNLYNAENKNNYRTKLSKANPSQINIPSASTDQRRRHIDLARARRGLKAEEMIVE